MNRPNPALTKFHELLHKELINAEKVPCCLTCTHFNAHDPLVNPNTWEAETCVKFGMLPPARVIVFGCEAWEGNDIPF